MKKRFLNFSLIGALLLGSAVSFVGCKDYDDDIDRLEAAIKKNADAIDAIQKLIDAGAVIKAVDVIPNGIKVTFSDGSTQDIVNGADGTNGTNGTDGKDGKVWEIDKDGYWSLDGDNFDQRYPSRGENGKDGQDGQDGQDGSNGSGTPGQDGKDGNDGKDGVYYEPREDGYFWIVDPSTGNATKSTLQWKVNTDNGESVNAVFEDGKILFISDGNTIYTLYLTNKLRSIVFEPQAYVGGVPVIDISTLRYTAQVWNNGDYRNTTAGNTELQKKEITAAYHLNPGTVTKSDIDTDNMWFYKKVVETRASGLVVTPSYNDIKVNDKGDTQLIVNVNINNPALVSSYSGSTSEIDIVALNVQVADDDNEIITSDYAGLFKSVKVPVNLSNKTVLENGTNGVRHFRRFRSEIDNDADAYIDTNAQVKYNDEKGLNLSKLVETCYIYVNGTTHSILDLAEYGFTYEFTPVDLYRDNEYDDQKTNQNDFAVIEENEDGESILYPEWKKATDGDGRFSYNTIGRTPLVNVRLMDGDKVVLSAYILTKITDRDPVAVNPLELTYSLTNVNVCASGTITTTSEQMNNILHELGLSNNEFNNMYGDPVVTKVVSPSANQLTVDLTDLVANRNTGGGTETHILEWTISNAQLWNSAVTYYEVVVTYPSSSTNDLEITLKLNVDRAVTPTLATRQNYNWNNNIGLFNVRVPKTNDPATECIFDSNINELYDIANATGKTLLQGGSPVYRGATVSYYFADSNNGKRAGSYTVSVVNRTELWAGGEKIAQITNNIGGEDIEDRIVYLNNDPAIELLMADMVYELAAVADLGCVTNEITKFNVMFINPLQATDTGSAIFYDAESDGNVLNVLDYITLRDWRKDENGLGSLVAPNTWLYTFYDVNERYIVDTNAIRFKDVNSSTFGNLPLTRKVYYGEDNEGNTLLPTQLFYMNEGTPVQGGSAYLLVPVKIYHKWGYVTENITIEIKPGVKQN